MRAQITRKFEATGCPQLYPLAYWSINFASYLSEAPDGREVIKTAITE